MVVVGIITIVIAYLVVMMVTSRKLYQLWRPSTVPICKYAKGRHPYDYESTQEYRNSIAHPQDSKGHYLKTCFGSEFTENEVLWIAGSMGALWPLAAVYGGIIWTGKGYIRAIKGRQPLKPAEEKAELEKKLKEKEAALAKSMAELTEVNKQLAELGIPVGEKLT